MKTFEPDERFSEFMGHSVPVDVADGERRSSFFPFVVIYCDRLMANIDFALRTLAGRVRRRAVAASAAIHVHSDLFLRIAFGKRASFRHPNWRMLRLLRVFDNSKFHSKSYRWYFHEFEYRSFDNFLLIFGNFGWLRHLLSDFDLLKMNLKWS